MHPIEYPLAFGHWHVQSDTLTCRMPRKELEVRAPRDLLRDALTLCTGRLRWSAVAARLARRWQAECVDGFLRHLAREGALVEASEALGHWAEGLGLGPAAFSRLASAEEVAQLPQVARNRLLPGRGALAGSLPDRAQTFAELLTARESYRTFADRPISADVLGGILWAAHGVTRSGADGGSTHRTVASGGNLHSARWLVFVLRELPGPCAHAVSPGIYEARFHLEGGTSLHPLGATARDAWRALVDPRALSFASALVLPVFDIALPARKYGNRATLFAAVEAGQCLQNAQLMAVALGAAACVRGDIAADVQELIARVVPAHSAVRVHGISMFGLLLGARPGQSELHAQIRGSWLQVASSPAGATSALRAGGAGSFSFRAGPVREGPRDIFASGRSNDPRLALAKAEAEAWERRAWATLGVSIECAATDLDAPIDPSLLVGYTRRQYASQGFPFQPFSVRRKYLWRQGFHALTGAAVSIPAECVHALSALPPAYQPGACTNSSTSGIAAWTDAEGALCRATLELIERDAFLRHWLSRRPAALMDVASIPQALRMRITDLEAAGHRVAIAQVGQRLAPVFTVFLQGTGRPFTAITAAADFDPEAALSKALDEAEGRAAHARRTPAEPLRSARDVRCPADINRFYQTARYYRRSDFYAAGPVPDTFGSVADRFCSDWASLMARLRELQMRLIAVDITPPGASIEQGRTPLHVVRAFVPGLLPIWFQYGLQPAAAVAAAPRGLVDAAFIHPFT